MPWFDPEVTGGLFALPFYSTTLDMDHLAMLANQS